MIHTIRSIAYKYINRKLKSCIHTMASARNKYAVLSGNMS